MASQGSDGETAQYIGHPNLNPFFAAPVAARLCKLTDYDERLPNGEPKLPLDKVCDLNEILIVDHENQVRAQKHAERKSRTKGRQPWQ